MPFSSGTFSRVHDWTSDRDAGIKISASRTDAEFDGIATALTSTMLKDGSQTLTAMIPFTLGLSVPTDKKLQLRDSAIFLNSSADGQADLVADSVIQVTAPTVNIEASTAITLESDAITLGENTDTDIVLTFNANSADGVITWKEDEDYFLLSDDILMNSTEKIQFGDTASFIQQSSDGVLRIDGEATVNVNASTAFTVTTDTATFTSANANDPVVIIKNTTNDTAAARLHFVKDKGAAGADGDDIGTIEFISDDDGQTQTSFAKIVAEVSESANTDEAGKLSFFVAESDGTNTALTAGLVIEGEHATDGEVDVTIGAATTSTTTVAGNLVVTTSVEGGAVFNESSADVDFRVESDGNANMLFVDGGNNTVGIGTTAAAPSRLLTLYDDNAFIALQSSHSGTAVGDGFQIQKDTSNNAYLWNYENATMNLATNNENRILLNASGAFFMGSMNNVLAATGRSGVNLFQDGSASFSSTAQPLYINRDGSDGELVRFFHDTNLEGNISVSGSTVSYNAFSGSHWSRLADNSKPTILKGTVVETIDEMCDWYKVEYEVEGKKHTSSISLPDNKKVGDTISFTVPDNPVLYDQEIIDETYTGTIIKETDNKHTKCKVSDTADSKRVYGVFADWDADDDTVNDMYVTAVGTHVVRINKDVTVTAGDLLSSNGDGTAKVQDDDIIRSKTIGKVLTNIKQETYNDGSYTVPCALYCG